MSLNALEFAGRRYQRLRVGRSIAMGLILPALVFLTFRVAAVPADV